MEEIDRCQIICQINNFVDRARFDPDLHQEENFLKYFLRSTIFSLIQQILLKVRVLFAVSTRDKKLFTFKVKELNFKIDSSTYENHGWQKLYSIE